MNIRCLVAVFPLLIGPQDGVRAETQATWHEPVTGMTFVSVPGGCYNMGNPRALAPERNRQLRDVGYQGPRFADEAPVHQVCLSPFWLGRYEVTAAQWQQVMGAPPPQGEEQAPAAGFSWQEAKRFAARLSELGNGESFRLPTEAEWEYACRAGRAPSAQPPYPSETAAQAWFNPGDGPIAAAPIGRLQANPWGLHDMLGNVWEWTADDYDFDAYQLHPLNNPRIDRELEDAVIRGAGFRSRHEEVRCGSRGHYHKHQGLPQIGLRLVRSTMP